MQQLWQSIKQINFPNPLEAVHNNSMENHIYLLILLFLFQYYSLCISAASSNETDQQALLAFKNLVTSPSHVLADNWTKNTSFCSWFGVTCSSRRQRVVALALPNLQLQGTISPSLANLSFLSVLNLGNNSLQGDIPYVLGHLPRLRVIDIQNNQLQGSIPTSLFQHHRVQKISLAFNKLSGEMWKGPWNVPKLSVLNLMNNSLTGIIPPSVGNATKLMNFSLSGNSINGNLPKQIGNLSQVEFLFLYDNQLTGSIPTSLFNISSLVAVALALNSLSGPLLLDEGNIVSNLEFLSVSNNQISGCIPSNICQLRELQVLSIYLNNIAGEIPRNIGCLSKLEKFYIGDNPIKGTIPTSIGNISNLQYFSCTKNRLEGPIPPELGKLSNLRQLGFGENYNLIGQIPEAIFNISSLEGISFSFNNLSGTIPATTGLHLPNLKHLHLSDNQLEGEIPLFITNASKLETLELSSNFLKGTIPTTLGNLRELHGLILHSNQLTNEPREHELQFFNSLADCRMLQYLEVGSNPLNGVLPNYIGNLSSTIEDFNIGDAHINGLFPTSIGNMSGLTRLGVRNNNLIGNIPPEIGNLKHLQGMYLQNNKLQGHIPKAVCHLSNLVALYLNVNELIGLIPACIGNLSMLEQLDLGSNRFSSKFPSSLWKMRGLLFLNVSQNSIEGEFPPDIGGLKAIVELYLSGTIPKSMGRLSYLKIINVSFNNLEGEIPSGGVFVNSTLQSFLGNKGLCGMHILEVPACTNPGLQSKSKVLVLKVVIPVVISFFLIFFLVSIWVIKRQKKGKSKDVEKIPDMRTHQLVSYHEIQRATNYFGESNLIGVGSSGSVYKGTLSGGSVVAIKILDLEYEEVCKRFDTECEVMRNVRHRNLVPVITTCSSAYIRAFVLQYMSNGSLENWLYREDYQLNLLQRVTVMLDAAMGIEYLHHGHFTPIVHCDLKPANILLDDDMVAHVGDFGISKILAVSKSMAYTETLGTLGYIAPEYGSEGIVSTNGDVYSYGIMLMEVLTKRRPTDEEICNENLDLRKWITQSFSGSMMDVIDDNLFPKEEQISSKSEICIASMIELALDCTKETPESRITMKDVVKRLSEIKITFLEM
ncbi:receptor kinase-like protein Xa21 [Capsicum galapagoense]